MSPTANYSGNSLPRFSFLPIYNAALGPEGVADGGRPVLHRPAEGQLGPSAAGNRSASSASLTIPISGYRAKSSGFSVARNPMP